MTMRLYSYFRSSASYRVRIALAYKNLPYEYVAVHLLRGEQKEEAHRSRNPVAQLPALELELEGKTRIVAQSLAILELLEELHPEPSLLPTGPFLRCRARELAEIVNAGIQPHQNLTTLSRLDAVQQGAGRRSAVYFNEVGLAALEVRVQETAGRCCIGDSPTVADVCLVPQLYSARRLEIDVAAKYPTLDRIDLALNELPAFAAAHPDRQPDRER